MIRKISLALGLLLAAAAISPLNAKKPPEKGVALGFLGVGDLDSDAQPTLRWKFANRHAFDFTPDISVSNSDSNSGSESDSFALGLDFSWVLTLASVQNMDVNLLTQSGFDVSNSESKFRNSSGVTTSKFNTDSWTAKIGIGPDFEYYFPFFPNLSIGAHALLFLSHNETRNKSTSFTSNTTTSSLAKTNSLSWGGQVFNLRYYFGGSGKKKKTKKKS